MAKQKRREGGAKNRGKVSLSLDRARDYVVYWQSGLKSVCHGSRLSDALDFYLSRARLILDAGTRERVWEA
jgi:hypothetical protein